MKDRHCVYEVGDTVVVKEWNTMADEYGLDSADNIPVPYSFTSYMAKYCGLRFEVASVKYDPEYDCYKFTLKVCKKHNQLLSPTFSEQMLMLDYSKTIVTTNIFGGVGIKEEFDEFVV